MDRASVDWAGAGGSSLDWAGADRTKVIWGDADWAGVVRVEAVGKKTDPSRLSDISEQNSTEVGVCL